MLYKMFLQSSSTVQEQVAQDQRMLDVLAKKYNINRELKWMELDTIWQQATADHRVEELTNDLKDCYAFYDFGFDNSAPKTNLRLFFQGKEQFKNIDHFTQDMRDPKLNLGFRWARAEAERSLPALILKLKIEFAKCHETQDTTNARIYTEFFKTKDILDEALHYQSSVNLHRRLPRNGSEQKGISYNPLVEEFWSHIAKDQFAQAREYALFFESRGVLEEIIKKQNDNLLTTYKMIIALTEVTNTPDERAALLKTQVPNLLSEANLQYLIRTRSNASDENTKIRFLVLNAITPISVRDIHNHETIRKTLLKFTKNSELSPDMRARANILLAQFDSMIFLARKGFTQKELEMFFSSEMNELAHDRKHAMSQALIERDKIYAQISLLTFLAIPNLPAVFALKATNSLSDNFRVGLCAAGLLLAHAHTSSKGNDVANLLNKALMKYLPEVWKSVRTNYALALPALATLVITDSVLATSAIGLCTALIVKAPVLIAKFAPNVAEKITRNYRMSISEFNTHCPEFLKKIPSFAKEHYALALPAAFTLAVSGSAWITTAIALCTSTYALAPHLSPGLNSNYIEPFKKQSGELVEKALESIKCNLTAIAVPTLITYAVSNSVLCSASACLAAAVLSFASDYLLAKGNVNYKEVTEKLKAISASTESFADKLQDKYVAARNEVAVGLL